MSKIISFYIFSLITTLSFSQNIEPLELAKKLLNKDSFEDLEKYSTGEFKGHPNGEDLGKSVKLNFRLLNQTKNSALVNVTIKDSLDKCIDTYLHFEKDSIWKISAFRALAMTGMLEQIKTEFEKMSESAIDSLIIYQKDSDHKMFETKEDFKYQLANIKLTLESDDNIINHFNKNKADFLKLKGEVSTIDFNQEEPTYRRTNLKEKLKSNYDQLLINSITTTFHCDDCFEFIIGGMLDNTVGYLYVKDIANLPEINPSRIIMIREIGNGWYIFKTT